MPETQPQGRSPLPTFAAAALLAAAILVADRYLPAASSIDILFVAVVLLGWWLPRRRHILALAAGTTAVIVVEHFFISHHRPSEMHVLDHALSVFVVWVTAALLFVIRKKERAHAESEQRYRDMTEAASDWVWEMGHDLRFTYFSETFQAISGVDPTYVLGKTRREVAAEQEDPVKWARHLDDLQSRRPFRDFVYEIMGADGATRHIKISGKPIYGADGAFRGYRGTGSNATAQVLAERRAEAAERQLLDAIESLSDGVVLYDADERFVACNTSHRHSHAAIADALTPGTTFEEACRLAVERGLIEGTAASGGAEWVRRRLARFRAPGPPELRRTPGGRWASVQDYKTRDGGTLIIQTDVSERIEAEQRAETAERQLLDAVESIEGGVVLVDAGDRFVSCNSTFRRNLPELEDVLVPGTPFEKIIRAGAERGLSSDAIGRVEDYVRERMARHRKLEPSVVHMPSNDRWYSLREYRTSDGGTLMVRTDITDLKRAEQALRQSETRLKAILDAVPALITVKDAGGRYQLSNRAHREFFGYLGDEYIGKTSATISAGHGVRIAKLDRAVVEEARTLTFTDTYRNAKGEDRVLLVNKAPLRAAAGDVIGIVSASADITDQKRAEQALRESEERFRDFAEIGADWFWEMDADLRFTYVSEPYYEITRRARDEIIGRTRFETADEEGLKAAPEAWRRHHEDLAARRPFNNFVISSPGGRGGRYEGRRYYLRLDGRPRFGPGGAFLGYRGTATDITRQIDAENALRHARDELERRVEERTRALSAEIEERRRIEQDLRRAKERAEISDRAKSEFLANMSHELRTPLNSIIGFSDMLKSGILGRVDDDRRREYMEDINASGRHLLELIEDILDVSKIEAGALEVNDEPVELTAVAQASIRMVGDRARRAMLEVKTEIPADLPPIRGDLLRIKQILVNLLSNAVKFTPPRGRVVIRAGLEKDGGVCVAVADTGIGIAPDDLKRVTEPFAQAAGPLTRRHEGTGLGLALVKSLVELHGGRLTIESALGKGTEVTVRFPPSRTLAPDARAVG